jgi:hypothetical protein
VYQATVISARIVSAAVHRRSSIDTVSARLSCRMITSLAIERCSSIHTLDRGSGYCVAASFLIQVLHAKMVAASAAAYSSQVASA